MAVRGRSSLDIFGNYATRAQYVVPCGCSYLSATATSPLRRFHDLVAHWQMKDALLPASERRGRTRPFEEAELVKLMKDATMHERVYTRVMRRHGPGQYLLRAEVIG